MGPDPAVAEVRRAVRGALAGSAGPVLVACSGGTDSLALAAATAFEAPRAGRPAGMVVVDHGLQAGSSEHARTVAAMGWELGFDPVHVVVVRVGTLGGLEAAARSARYAALSAAAQAVGADVLLGHTLDDQAETVLLGLGRGSGPRSIAGMRAVDGRYRRPLLGVRRATTRRMCVALGLVPWDDPHNADPAYQRARLRHEVLPLLEDVLQGGVAEALARTAALVRLDLETLDVVADTALPSTLIISDAAATDGVPVRDDHGAASDSGDDHRAGSVDRPATSVINSRGPVAGHRSARVDHGTGADAAAFADADAALDAAALADLPAALRTRILRRWARRFGTGPLAAVHLTALDALVTNWHGQGPLDLPGGCVVQRVSGRLTLAARRPPGRSAPPEE